MQSKTKHPSKDSSKADHQRSSAPATSSLPAQTPVFQQIADESPHVSQLKNYQNMADNRPRTPVTQVPVQRNNTGMPDTLKSGMEHLSGMDLSDVKVHYNSPRPAQLQAHAYAQQSDIHVAPGQEKHVPHEAWHVVQQKQGRVKPTANMGGVALNDDSGLEKEADHMGAKALQMKALTPATESYQTQYNVLQRQAAVVQRASAFSKTVIEDIFPAAAFELMMVGEYEMSLITGCSGFLKDSIEDNSDHSEALAAFLHVYTGLLRKGQKYIIVAEAFKKTVMERLRAMEGQQTFPAKTIRLFVIAMLQATAKYASLLDPYKGSVKKPKDILSDDSSEEESELSSDFSDDSDSPDDRGEKPLKKHSVDQMEEEEKEIVWTYDKAKETLEKSQENNPLSYGTIKQIETWLNKSVTSVSRSQSKELAALIKKAKSDADAYDLLTRSTRPAPKKTRGPRDESKKTKAITFGKEKEAESEVSDLEELDPDKRLKKYPSSMSAIANRSHLYGEEDTDFRKYVTGLPHADTYLGLFKNGSLVPRLINGERNTKGRRKKMSDVEKTIKPALSKKETLFKEWDGLNEELNTGELRGTKLTKKTEDRNEKYDELHDHLMKQVRPHVESIIFGSSGGHDPKDIEATSEAADHRQEIRSELVKSGPSIASKMMTTQPGKGIETGTDSSTHAEQTLINTETWLSLRNGLIETIKTNKDQPENIRTSSYNRLQLVLNRSTCLGCAKELTADLVSFWELVAKATGLKSWREAKYVYEDYVHFMIDFPAIYQSKKESKQGNANITRILQGLRDAGWQIRIISGIHNSEKGDLKNKAAKELVNKINNVPSFFVPNWTSEIVRFPVPEGLAEAVKANGQVIINGILYQLSEDGKSLSHDPNASADSMDASALSKVLFLKTGALPPQEDKSEKKEERSDLGKKYDKAKHSILLKEYDPILESMLMEHDFIISNVSGAGMNCLIRAIFRAAGVDFDEAMVKIVRDYLISLGLTENGDMLDLLNAQGDSLIHFMHAQGVLQHGNGITVHFPGDSMEVVPGNEPLHLWYDNYHFQAIVKKG